MVGRIYLSYFKYYDLKKHKTLKKSRPVLIIKKPEGSDAEYTVLPISSVSRKEFLNDEYDVPLEIRNFPKITITRNCYIRTHKQTTIYKADINFNKCIGDLKSDYNKTYIETMNKLKKFNSRLRMDAL